MGDEQEKKKSLVPLDDAKERFGDFLNVEGNKRILFSGKFGSGKTFFLREFFEGNESYEFFHLYPVRYQLSGDRDVLELIRYDIVRLLLSKGDKQARLENLVSEIEAMVPAIGTAGAKIMLMFLFSKLGVGYNDLKEICKEYKQAVADDKQAVPEFMKSVETNIDILSVNCIDEWISEEINKPKEQKTEGNKKSVLIIDDIDRLDPMHIFRILNVLSVSMYDDEEKNRYEFDYILIVGDVENIKKIFRHTYGEATDVEGYLSKFFTSSIYEFSIYDALILSYEKIVEEYGLAIKLEYLLTITADLIAARLLNIRHLSKPIKCSIHVKESGDDVQLMLRILSGIIGGDDGLVNVFVQGAKSIPDGNENKIFYRKRFMKLIARRVHRFATREDGIAEAKEMLNKFNIDSRDPSAAIDFAEQKYEYKVFYELLAEYVKHGLHKMDLQ